MMTAASSTTDDPPSSSDSTYNLTYRMNSDASINNSSSPPITVIPRRKRSTGGCLTYLQELYTLALENHTIELLMFFHMVGYTCTTLTVQNLYISRICRLHYNYSDPLCSNLTNNPKEEKEVEQIASMYNMYRSVIEALVPIMFALFLGPFVDRNGSKVPILFSLGGYVVASLMYGVISLFPSVPAGWVLICSVPISLTGGLVAFLMCAFTLVSNHSTIENRSFRIAVLEGCWFIGTLGFLLASKIYKEYSFLPVFLLSALSFSLAFLYGYYFIKEPKQAQYTTMGNLIREIFDTQSFLDTIGTVVRKRQGPLRTWVWVLMGTMFLRMLALFGTMQVAYLYTRNKFGWGMGEFSKFTMVDTWVTLTGGLLALIFMKAFKIGDPLIGMFSAVGFVLSNLCYASANAGWVMYFGATIQMFSGLITIVMRSMISKCVAKDETAKAFSFASIGEAAMPLVAGLLFNPLYSSTVSSFPGAVFLVSGVMHGVILFGFIYLYFGMRQYPFLVTLEEEHP